MLSLLLYLLSDLSACLAVGSRPNIVVVVADDLGWNDVSFHGSNQIPTPNIDKLARAGVILNNYYVTPICTPSRGAIMTGKYPVHTGLQHDVILSPQPWGLDPNEKILPQYLKDLGYATHAVGKWHLGFCQRNMTPTHRGFDSFYGYYCGKSDYWDHSDQETYWGLDLHSDEDPVFTQWGNYSTHMYTQEAIGRILDHDTSQGPLFLYLAYQAVHSANTAEDPIQAPKAYIDKFAHIENVMRRKFAAVVSVLDEGIGKVYEALQTKGILDNTIIVFTTDNGGPPNGFDMNWANNFPLRGGKANLYEGGVRGTGFVFSPLIANHSLVSNAHLHITDWLPTLYAAAGGNTNDLGTLDGLNGLDTLFHAKPSPRAETLLNIDTMIDQYGIRFEDWKLLKDPERYWDQWFSAPGANPVVPGEAVVTCPPPPSSRSDCSTRFCLFNIVEDPCEHQDVSVYYPDVVAKLQSRLEAYKMSAIAPRFVGRNDPESDPKLHGGVWQPWMS